MSLNIVSSFNGVTDPDAGAYIAAVEAADGQLLEFAVGKAINDFVVGCKADGIWDAIKASCILAGARTRLGALTPLVGTAPISFNFVDANYNRKTGLVGDGSTKYLASNRANSADPQNNNHNAVYASTAPSGGVNQTIIGSTTSNGGNALQTSSSNSSYFVRNRNGTGAATGVTVSGSAGFLGVSRSTSSGFTFRAKGITSSEITSASQAPTGDIDVFRTLTVYTNARLAFYSIGESLDLAKLDARVTALITAFGAAIP
jgi:hypothetical protein